MGVFRAYDIRGIYPSELDETLAYKIGRAIVLYLKSKSIAIGRDCRLSSPALTKSLIYGITDQGADVINLGLINTPCAYFASRKHDSVMVTASHNPPEYNGFKVTGKGLNKISGEQLQKIGKIVAKDDFPAAKRKGVVTQQNIIPEYAKSIRALTKTRIKPLKVLFDAGNGMAGLIVPELLKGLPVKYNILFAKPDGSFPNHIADPVKPGNTAKLQRHVRNKYDFGVAYDTDCDRAAFIDDRGERVRPEHVLLLFAKLIKAKKIVKTVNCSKIIEDESSAKIYVCPVGSANVAKAMKKHNADIGVEVAGHFFFKKLKFMDSGDAAVMMMLAALSKSGKKLSELVAPFASKYATGEEINFKVKDKRKVLSRVEREFRNAKIRKLDGLSIDTGEFWFNIRESKNEPLLRLNAEARTKKALKECISCIKRITQHL
ncbi:phosphomannomutase/phosphoglucomutase [Candidatus Woesearchaeota archaeon]|nr:phosphomannomutase/phosphoglucomutase [Candidatus Woesearchaeota archaeon]